MFWKEKEKIGNRRFSFFTKTAKKPKEKIKIIEKMRRDRKNTTDENDRKAKRGEHFSFCVTLRIYDDDG